MNNYLLGTTEEGYQIVLNESFREEYDDFMNKDYVEMDDEEYKGDFEKGFKRGFVKSADTIIKKYVVSKYSYDTNIEEIKNDLKVFFELNGSEIEKYSSNIDELRRELKEKKYQEALERSFRESFNELLKSGRLDCYDKEDREFFKKEYRKGFEIGFREGWDKAHKRMAYTFIVDRFFSDVSIEKIKRDLIQIFEIEPDEVDKYMSILNHLM